MKWPILNVNVASGAEVKSDKGCTMRHDHSDETDRRVREAALDETLSATFPASDALSTLPNPDDDSVYGAATTDEQNSVIVYSNVKARP